MNGHWFCEACGERVCLPKPVGRWDLKASVTCPLCHLPAAEWVNDGPPPVAQEVGKQLFQQMKELIK